MMHSWMGLWDKVMFFPLLLILHHFCWSPSYKNKLICINQLIVTLLLDLMKESLYNLIMKILKVLWDFYMRIYRFYCNYDFPFDWNKISVTSLISQFLRLLPVNEGYGTMINKEYYLTLMVLEARKVINGGRWGGVV
jgi:hypothetical protein